MYSKALKQASKMSNRTTEYQGELPALRLKLYLNLAMVGKGSMCYFVVLSSQSHCTRSTGDGAKLRLGS